MHEANDHVGDYAELLGVLSKSLRTRLEGASRCFGKIEHGHTITSA